MKTKKKDVYKGYTILFHDRLTKRKEQAFESARDVVEVKKKFGEDIGFKNYVIESIRRAK